MRIKRVALWGVLFADNDKVYAGVCLIQVIRSSRDPATHVSAERLQ